MIKKFGYYQALNVDNLIKMQIWTFFGISEAYFSNVCMFICFTLFLAFWAPPNGPKKVPNTGLVGRMNGPMSKLRNKPLTKSFGPLF